VALVLTECGCLQHRVQGVLNAVRDAAGRLCMRSLHAHNAPFIMASCGSKGSAINIAQMVALVGQQSVGGKRCQNGFVGRTTPHFPRCARLCHHLRSLSSPDHTHLLRQLAVLHVCIPAARSSCQRIWARRALSARTHAFEVWRISPCAACDSHRGPSALAILCAATSHSPRSAAPHAPAPCGPLRQHTAAATTTCPVNPARALQGRQVSCGERLCRQLVSQRADSDRVLLPHHGRQRGPGGHCGEDG
jgi:RNA polymerase Rpb1, domain 4